MATAQRLMDNGVIIQRPETVVIDARVEVGADTVIEPFAQLLGRRGWGATAGSGRTRCWRTRPGDQVTILHSCVIEDARIDEERGSDRWRICGRDATSAKARISAIFVEAKKTASGEGFEGESPDVSGRRGDRQRGEHRGEETITCNYDG